MQVSATLQRGFTLVMNEDIFYTIDNVTSIPEEGTMRHLKTTIFIILPGINN
jgi:hypothetical protein